MKQIDSDNSNTITAVEFLEAVVNNLDMEAHGISVIDIVEDLKYNKGLNINQSATFTDFNFYDERRTVSKKDVAEDN